MTKTTTLTLTIEGMKCGSCEGHVRSALERAPGVVHATVSVKDGLGTIEYDPSRVTPGVLIAAVIQTGYGARVADAHAPGVNEGRGCGCGAAR